MLTIAINSSTPQTAVAILSEEKSIPPKLLGQKSWLSKRNEAEKILPAITALLKKSRANFRDVKKVLVINGPGPFTGMRVGVTIANAIAWAANSKIQSATVDELLKIKSKSFGEAAIKLLKKPRKTTKLAKPLYSKTPHITVSKKPQFVISNS